MSFADRMRDIVLGMAIPHSSSSTGKFVTISAGVSTMVPRPGQPSANLLDAADKARHEAAQSGE